MTRLKTNQLPIVPRRRRRVGRISKQFLFILVQGWYFLKTRFRIDFCQETL